MDRRPPHEVAIELLKAGAAVDVTWLPTPMPEPPAGPFTIVTIAPPVERPLDIGFTAGAATPDCAGPGKASAC